MQIVYKEKPCCYRANPEKQNARGKPHNKILPLADPKIKLKGGNNMSYYETFKKYAVPADSVQDFLNRYHKKSSYTGRGEEYAKCVLKSYQEEFKKYGFCFTSHHDSVTGEVVAFYGKEVQW
jgi:hypothetical protein